jgi:hypothetical protein
MAKKAEPEKASHVKTEKPAAKSSAGYRSGSYWRK